MPTKTKKTPAGKTAPRKKGLAAAKPVKPALPAKQSAPPPPAANRDDEEGLIEQRLDRISEDVAHGRPLFGSGDEGSDDDDPQWDDPSLDEE